jgi:hypothetical protein
MSRFYTLILSLSLGVSAMAQHHHGDHAGHAGHSDAPISIMGDHVHPAGELMFSYRYMYMDMDGMRNGTSDVSSTEVFGTSVAPPPAPRYMVTPTDMQMEMHMLGAMYAPNDDITLMLMIHHVSKEMDHVAAVGTMPFMQTGGKFTAESEGLGDTTLSATMRLHADDSSALNLSLGLSLPTGSINETDTLPGMGGLMDRQMPAPMQLGSGTVDFLPAITYSQFHDHWFWGCQARGTIRTHENHHDYHWGHKFNLDVWAVMPLTESLSISAKVGYQWEDELDGDQTDVAQTMGGVRTVTTAFGENYGGDRIDISVGASYTFASGIFEGHRLGADVRMPLYQDLNGYQLETDMVVTVGWQKAF